MKIKRLLYVIGMALLPQVGCDLDFVDLEDPNNSTFRLEVESDTSDVVRVRALMPFAGDPGDESYRPQLILFGTAVEGVFDERSNAYLFDSSWSRRKDLGSTGLLPLVVPGARISDPASPVTVHVPVRTGADSLTVRDGHPIEFAAPEVRGAPHLAGWSLSVQNAKRVHLLSLRGNGPPPATMVLPREWLTLSPSGNPHRLHLHLSQLHEHKIGSSQRSFAASVGSSFQWKIVVEP